MRNYARHVTSGQVVFFEDMLVPMHVLDQAHMWATWYPVISVERMKIIGEGPDDYCGRNRHQPRSCRSCKHRHRSMLAAARPN